MPHSVKWPFVRDIAHYLVYNSYYTLEVRTLPDYNEASRIVKAIVEEIANQKKIPGHPDVALALCKQYFQEPFASKIMMDDVIEAFAIAAGGGMEFEWPIDEVELKEAV